MTSKPKQSSQVSLPRSTASYAALAKRRVVLGVSGGIACYKAIEVLRLLRGAGAEVRVVLTREARRFVSALTFETFAGTPVASARLGLTKQGHIEHIQLAQWAEVIFVVPCTANLMASMRCGLAQDTLSATLLASSAAVMLAPAMNDKMWQHAATQENLRILQERQVHVIPPAYGELAEGYQGIGRLPEPQLLVSKLNDLLARSKPTPLAAEIAASTPSLQAFPSLKGKKLLITAGPTIEDIDPVRFLGNHSSGKMGYALAQACQQLGAAVTLVSGPVQLTAPPQIHTLQVRSSESMRKAVLQKQPQQDALILCAAVSDFIPKQGFQTEKIKRQASPLTLTLAVNADIAQAVGERKSKGQLLIIFAAEHSHSLLAEAKRKMHIKNADMVVANPIDQAKSGFYSDFNQATILLRSQPNQPQSLPCMSKLKLAQHLAQLTATLL